ncbi:hypothetical protein N7504_006801 [Penicillium tannophilum]|nr:hypothetical protein N7504_006801 [Penicillium tannophilum]
MEKEMHNFDALQLNSPATVDMAGGPTRKRGSRRNLFTPSNLFRTPPPHSSLLALQRSRPGVSTTNRTSVERDMHELDGPHWIGRLTV